MIINDLDGYYIVFDTKNWNTELDTLFVVLMVSKASQMPSKAYFLRVLCSSVLSIRYAILSSMLAVSIKRSLSRI